jgi:hypothetical protein
VEVQGPKGSLQQPLPRGIGFELEGDELQARIESEEPGWASSTASRAASWPTP